MLNVVAAAARTGLAPVIERLARPTPVRMIQVGFVADAPGEDFRDYGAAEHHVVKTPAPPFGAACAALLASRWIDSDDELLIVEGSQPLRTDLAELTDNLRTRDLDAGAATASDRKAGACFFRLDESGAIIEAIEGEARGARAAAGPCWFRHGRLFVDAARRLIRKDPNRPTPFPVELAFNELVLAQRRLGALAFCAEAC